VNGPRHRITHVLGMQVVFVDGRRGDHVIDVRLGTGGPVRGRSTDLMVVGMVVGRARPGSLFGYDRHPDQGPWMVRKIVRRLHRHSGYVAWEDVAHVDWESRTVQLRTNELRDLTAARNRDRGARPDR
jgi:hypothetical protein